MKDNSETRSDAEPSSDSRVPASQGSAAPSAPSHTLDARGLKKSYKGRAVVRGVDIHVDKGEVVGLLGPNGAGKTTSFYMILGLVRPDEGKIEFSGKDVTRYPVYRRARAGLGYMAQEPSIFRKLSVEKNIWAILETVPIPRAARKARLEELLERFDLKKVRRQYAYTLSGGERRKLEIARALVRKPSILMLDEPFAGVDPLSVNEIQDIVRRLASQGLGIIITDHNVRETLSVVDRAYLVYNGRLLCEGTSERLVNDEEARRLYLGEDFRM